MSHTSRPISMALIATALASLTIGSTVAFFNYEDQQSFALESIDNREAPQPPQQALEHAENLSGAFKHAAGVIRPSVVSVRSTKTLKSQPRGGNLQRGPAPELPQEFRDFFERFGGADPFGDQFPGGSPFQPQQRQGGMRQEGQGTGVIVSKDGFVVTNNHVVDGADEVEVQLVDGHSYPAKVIGTDAKTDVAVLKIEGSNFTPAVIGDSDKMDVGDWVVAVGSPFGLQHTVTAGIVSAKSRGDVGIVEYEDFIQTDAAINPGNSGGPLVNLRGEVIGINTAIASRSGSFAGVGFSIPMNMVQSVVRDIMDDGQVQRGWLGAAIQNLDEDLAASFNYDSTHGVLVGQVVKDSPAEKAGLQAGDIIVHLNGRAQRNANSLRNQVARIKPNTAVPMVVVRNGKQVALNVTIGLLDEKAVARAETPTADNDDTAEVKTDLGLTVRNLTPQVAKRFELDETLTGVIVTEVDADSLAGRAGVRQGDVVLSVNDQVVEDAEQFEKIVAKLDANRGIRLHLSSGGFQRFVFMKSR